MHSAGLLLAVLALVQAAPENPFVGTWTANISKSTLHPSSQFQSVMLQIGVAGDTMTMASEIVNTSGQTQRSTETFRTDGTETAGTLSAGVTLIAKWLGSHVLASIATKNGQVFALVTYEISADGKTLTSRSSGMIEQVIVYDRRWFLSRLLPIEERAGRLRLLHREYRHVGLACGSKASTWFC